MFSIPYLNKQFIHLADIDRFLAEGWSMEKTQNTMSGHKLIMDARKEARITGVEKVISFDPNNTHTAKAVDCCSNISVII